MFSWGLAAALALSAPTPVVAGPQTAAPTQAEIMAVPPALQAQFQDAVLAGQPSQATRLRRLVHFMFDPQDGLGMAYQEDATTSVAQAYATRKANCLTFTLLFLALARAAGLDAYPQEIGETLTWREAGGTIYRNNHVNAGVRIGGRQYAVDVAGNSVLGLHPPVQVPDQRLMALYYNNLAIDRLEHGELPLAQHYMTTALALDPGYATHWSNAGVLRLRSGDVAGAGQDYAKALALDANNAGALFNMVELSRRLGDARREADYRQRLARVQQRDPLHHFLQASDFERIGDYPHAIEHYRRAIQLHGGEHRFHAALARAYLLAGDTRRAAKALDRAQALSDGDTRAAYRAQLDRLRQGAN